MRLPEALDAVDLAGGTLVLARDGTLRVRGRVPKDVLSTLRAHREQVAACLRLRALHRSAGFSDEAVRFIERTILSGTIAEVVVVPAPGQAARLP